MDKPNYATIIDFVNRIHVPHKSELFTVLFRVHKNQKLMQRVMKIVDLPDFLEKEQPTEVFYCVGSLAFPLKKKKNKDGNMVLNTDANSIGSLKEIVIDIDRKKSLGVRELEAEGFLNFDMDVVMEIYRELGFFDAVPQGYYLVKTGGGFHLHYPINPIVLNSPQMKSLYKDLVAELKEKVSIALEATLDKIMDARYHPYYDRYRMFRRKRTDMADNPYLSAAYHMKLDRVVGSLRQMVRVPGSINLKTGSLVEEKAFPFPVLETPTRHRAGDLLSLLKFGCLPKRNGNTFDPDLPQKIEASRQKRLYASGSSYKAVRLQNFIKGIQFIANTTNNFEGRRQNLLFQAAWLCADAGYGEMTSFGFLKRVDNLFGDQKWAKNDNELMQKVRDGRNYHAKRPKLTDEALKEWDGAGFSAAEKRAFGYYNRSQEATQKTKRQEKLDLAHEVYHFVAFQGHTISQASREYNLARATVRSYVQLAHQASTTEKRLQMERIKKRQAESENPWAALLAHGVDTAESQPVLTSFFGDILQIVDG